MIEHNAERLYGFSRSLDQELCYKARIEGKLPDDMQGFLYRGGPGLFARMQNRKSTILDGDGVVHSYQFVDGDVWFRARFVRTRKFKEEEQAKAFLYPTWTTLPPKSSIYRHMIRPSNQASVSVVPKFGKLFAFDEGTLPHALDARTLETIGQVSLFDPRVRQRYNAHPKTDGQSGDWVHFGMDYARQLAIHFTVLAADSSLRQHWKTSMPTYPYVHDFFITDRDILINSHPATVNADKLFIQRMSLLDSMEYRPDEGNLFFIFDKVTGQFQTIETPPHFMWHSCNAYRRGQTIVADFIGYDGIADFFAWARSAITDGEIGLARSQLLRLTLDLTTGRATEQVLAEGRYEFPVVHPAYLGHPYRHCFIPNAEAGDVFHTSIDRIDTETGAIVRYSLAPGSYGLEPVFVPGANSANDTQGYLCIEVYNQKADRTELEILRADHIEDGPIARIVLDHTVPFSFHGFWSDENSQTS